MSDWTEFLTVPGAVKELYEVPPGLDVCDLFYFHVDERLESVTLGFDTRNLPTNPREDWLGAEFNTFEFYVQFVGVTELRISGWTGQPHHDFSLARTVGGRLVVTISGADAGQGARFLATEASLVKSRVYLAGGQ
ncbi:Imm50 family immunity protein [Streptomyces sp. NPDC023838]|uniref:Imm50 family immunity protein n=1 Tax=Streptomyces sp. NPDC023838 TaxID=3154325 RepID=UPI00340E9A08